MFTNNFIYFKPFLFLLPFLFQCTVEDNDGNAVFPAEKWEVRTAQSQQVDPDRLVEALEVLRSYCGEDGTEEVVIVRNGYIIWQGDSIHNSHNIWSTTKSFTSTILGLLIEKGKCKLTDRAFQWESSLDTGKYSRISLKHFTTMTSGYNAVGGNRWGEESEDWSATPYDPGKPIFEPGTKFCYWDEAMMMFGRTLTVITGQPLIDFFMENIGKEIGLEGITWDTEGEVNGIPINNGCTGINITPLQLARFGWLFLNGGNWNGKQLINKEWIHEATGVQVPVFVETADTDRANIDGSGSYGYNWWINAGRSSMPDSPASIYYTSGFNNNMCFVIPEWDMVVVRMGLDGNPPEGKQFVYNEFFKSLSKAIIK